MKFPPNQEPCPKKCTKNLNFICQSHLVVSCHFYGIKSLVTSIKSDANGKYVIDNSNERFKDAEQNAEQDNEQDAEQETDLHVRKLSPLQSFYGKLVVKSFQVTH